MATPHPSLPIIAAALTGILVGAAIVATRFVVGEVGPASLAMLRYMIGFMFLLPVVLVSGPIRFARRDILAIALLGIGQFGVLIALLNFGLQFMTAARAALIFATLPLLAMGLAVALGREQLTAPKIIGVLLTIVGVGAVLGGKLLTSQNGTTEWLGIVAVLASAVVGAVCSVYYRPYLQRYPTVPISAFAMLSSVVFLAGLAVAEGSLGDIASVSPAGWVAIGFIGLSSAFGYLLWLWALKHATPTRVTVFLSLSPVTAALLGVAILGETISASLVIGLACVAWGLFWAHRN